MKNDLLRALIFARAHRHVLVLSLSLFLLILLSMFPEARAWIWSVTVVDIIVIVIVAGTLALVFLGKRHHSVNTGHSLPPPPLIRPEGLTALVAALAIFVTYASFRNQSRLAAEIGLNSEGQMLFELEMSNPNLRCLYTNFAHDNAQVCLESLVSDPDEWSASTFYIEGMFWLLEKAEDDRKAWGSAYSKEIDYWREYVNEDPTGLFSFYLISFNRGLDGAQKHMRRANVRIEGLCRRYRLVHAALEVAGANPEPSIQCP